MKRTLAFLCALALMLSLVPGAAFAATQDLQAEIDAGAETIVLEADASDITVTRDTTIDLNGHDLSGVTVLSGTLYLQDSQTADYTVADGVYGHVTGVTGNVKAAEGYLQVGDSFHAVNLDIYAMTLRATDVGVYYKSHFAADEIVAAQVESFGVALSVITAPNASNLETYCGYSDFTGFEAGEGANSVGTSTLLKGIMKAANGDSKNAKNAAMPVYGRAYIKTADGYFFGETVKRSLQEQVEAIDKVWNKLTDAQKTPVLAMLEGYTTVMENWNIPNIRGIQVPGADADIEIPIEVTAENGVVTETVTVEANGVCVTVPAGTKLAANATGLTVLVTEKETSEAGLTLEESEVLMPMDVHVEGLAADNTAPLTIYLGKVMAENLNMGNYAVYHVENGKANEMVLIPVDAEFTAHNQYKYSLDGELTLYMATFSEVAVVSEEPKWEGEFDYSWYTNAPVDDKGEKIYEIRNADQLAAFGAIVGGMKKVTGRVDGKYTYSEEVIQDSFSGKTIKLLADIDLDDAESENKSWNFHPIGYWNNEGTYERLPVKDRVKAVSSGFYAFEGTFDGNGNTISNFYHNTWEIKGDHNWYSAITEQYFRDGMGLFGKVYGGTVKNLTVKNFSSDGEIATTGVIAAYADFGAKFENIAIFNCNPRVYNIGNGGIVGCVGWYTKGETKTPVTFKNISVDNSNKISALWGTYDVSCGGIVGQYYAVSGQGDGYANAGMSFENCHVAAVMDVHNDVCANYQYYWYRYSGMMIGTIRANIKDKNGYTVADTRGIEFVDCTYTLGDWNQYWYCELVKNSLASYTHDHQFSRLTTIKSLSEIQDENGNWDTEGNFVIPNADNTAATCYHIFKNSEGNLYQHFHDKGDETNGNQPYETVNGVEMLKEDRTCYFIPFNQIYNGLGYGVKPTYKYADDPIYTDGDSNDLKEVAGGTVKADKKFESLGTVTTYRPGQTITLGQLVNSIVDETKLSKTSIYAAVSPATENDDVKATYSLNLSDWTNSTITFAEDCTGSAKIVITDYFYCTPTVIYLNPEQAAEKFTANTVGAQNAYTQITLGTLFGVKDGSTIGNVTATVTDPNGNETTVTGTSSDWTTKTIDLIKDGQWTVVIKDDDAFCTVTKVTFDVNPVNKFTKKFDKNFLYRVGNANAFDIGYIFGEKETAISLSSVNVTIENVVGNAVGSFTADAKTWTAGTIQFTGTGVVEVTITADGANAVSIYLEVVNATNAYTAPSTTTGEDFVLLQNISTNTYKNYWNSKLYGNGFTYSLAEAPTTYNSKQGHGILITKNATFDNIVIIGDEYSGYGAFSENNYYNSVIDAQGETVIKNSYIANCSAPVRAKANVTIKDTTLYGGAVANLLIEGGTVTLENVVTVNFDDGQRAVVGLGIVAGPSASDAAKLVLNGTLTQYNFISEANKPNDMQAKTLYNEIFSQCDGYYFGSSPNRYINTGICSMSANFTIADVEDNANTGYDDIKVTLNSTNGFLYSQKYTSGMQVNNGYDKAADWHIASVQGAAEPEYEFDYTTKNNYPQQSGSNDYCFGGNGVVNISMDDGDTFPWDTSILTLTKVGKTLPYTVTMNSTDYSGKSIAFNKAGSYTVEYSYTDPYNYRLAADGSIEAYEVKYKQNIVISVAVAKAAWKNAEIKVTKTAMNGIYVMSGDYDYSYKMKFLDCVTITDYKEDGTSVPVTLTTGIKSVSFISWDSEGTKTDPGKFDHNNGKITITYNDGKVLTVSIGAWSGSGPSNKACSVKTDSGVYLITDGASNAANTGVTWKITGYTYTGNNGAVVSNDSTITFTWDKNSEGYNSKDSGGCVTPDTLVTLADGTQKEIQYVQTGEEVLVWNFYTGTYDVAPVSIVFNHGTGVQRVLHLEFEDGTEVKVIANHGFYDVSADNFVFIEESNVESYIGHEFVKQSGNEYTSVKLVNYYVEEEYTTAYALFSYTHVNCILEGMFTITPAVIEANFYMPYEMGEGMKYDEAGVQADLEKYGIYSYEELSEYMSYEQYVGLNMPYLKVSVGKGLMTHEEVIMLIKLFIPYDPQ